MPMHGRGMEQHLTPQQKRAKSRRDAADRARAYRSRHRRTGRPLPRDCDSAIVEALAYWLAAEKIRTGATMAPADLSIPVRDLLKTARRILVERAGADKLEATAALGRRIGPRDAHTWSGYVPKLPRSDG
jgi:hypothetical protein